MTRTGFPAIMLACIILFANAATAVERHVPSEYPTIQAAIDASIDGDVVIVEPGTYTGTGDSEIADMDYRYPSDPNSDLNGDAFIDFTDYAISVNDWLQSPDPCDPNNIYRLAHLVADWLTCLVTEATNPEPSNDANNVIRDAILRWSPGDKFTSHDVFFGTDFNEVNDADITSSEVYMGNQDANYWDTNNYAPAGLDFNTTYYWRIDEVAARCGVKGDVWSFTAGPNIVSGLAAWWKFDETSGTIAHDSAGANNGNVYGATWTTGKIDGALSFDGTNDYVDCGSGPSNYDNITVSAWMKTSTNGVLVSTRYSSGSYGTWYTLSSTSIEVGDNSHGGYMNVTFSATTLDDIWHHIVYTKDGINHAVYVDGSPDQSFTSNADISWIVPMFIGKRWTKTTNILWFNGVIDDVHIYNRALAAEEVALLFQQGQ
jgi:hypothetical protein